jgi:hypothetical protein
MICEGGHQDSSVDVAMVDVGAAKTQVPDMEMEAGVCHNQCNPACSDFPQGDLCSWN